MTDAMRRIRLVLCAILFAKSFLGAVAYLARAFT